MIKDHKYYVLDRVTEETKDLPYMSRIIDIDDRLEFEFTCRNLTELINSPVSWGLDSRGKVFNLSKNELFTISTRSIKKIENQLIWLKGISYPFPLEKSLNIEDIDSKTLKVNVVYIDYTWILHSFTYDNYPKGQIRL